MAALNGTSHAGRVMMDAPQDPHDVERARLQAEIDALTARIDDVQRRKEERQAALRDAVERSRSELAELERQHDRAVTALRESAAAEVERILYLARQQVATHEFVEAPDGGDHVQ